MHDRELIGELTARMNGSGILHLRPNPDAPDELTVMTRQHFVALLLALPKGVELDAPVVEEPAPVEDHTEPETVAEVIELTGPLKPGDRLAGGHVRDAVRRLRRFTKKELVAELERPQREVDAFFKPMVLGGAIRDTGQRFGRAVIYEYARPDAAPVERIRHTPPEKLPPAGTERRATGMPVRVSAQKKITRRGRSTPGVGHQAKQRDKRYEQMQEAKAAAAEAQKAKAQKDPKWKRKK
jgi:hypothetical protein